MKLKMTYLKTWFAMTGLAFGVGGCYSPAQSQKYFVEASMDDTALEPIYSTSLYTVYFDYALARCVIHSTFTWGQNGGGGGGTGIGIEAFRCDPNRVRQRAESIGLKTYEPKMAPRETYPRRRTTSPSVGSPSTLRATPPQSSASDGQGAAMPPTGVSP
jgi:hypothetical protein